MTPTQQRAALNAANCEVASDNLTRQLYATDASIYQIEPVAVAFPNGARQACSIVRAAAEAGLPVIPRGAGTGLAGGAVGEGLVVDFARHNRRIANLNLDKCTVRVGAGVVLDELNNFLRPYGFWFGPDVATSSRATLGGMIANDSSGAHAPVYGTTADHVSELEIVLGDGRLVEVGPDHNSLPQQREMLESLAMLNSLQIAERFPPGFTKHWPGYALGRIAREPSNLANVITGSEGTLAAVVSAELKISPLPKERGVGLVFFKSVAEATRAATELLDLKPAAIEHLDRVLLDQTRGQLEFKAARDLLELDVISCESLLIVEFFEDVRERLDLLARQKIGLRKLILQSEAQAGLVWALRKAGLSLLTGCRGSAKPVAFIEDAAVWPRDLPEYTRELQKLMNRLGLQASYYGHAAAGLLHVRPVLDLHSAEDLKKFRQIADEVAALIAQFKGALSAEHGVGIARTEYLKDQVGGELYALMEQIKHAFDPGNVFNPGKIISDGRYKIEGHLRGGAGYSLKLPFAPVLAFAAKDGSFVGNLEQCNGCGGCLKETPTMCPTYIATGEEIMSTRGRANAIRAALELRGLHGADPLRSRELEAALSNCLACKACAKECPSNVNMALLKAELMHGRIQRDGLRWRERIFSSVDFLGRMGCALPLLANLFLDSRIMRFFGSKFLGITSRRKLPHYARQRFDRWFEKHPAPGAASRGRVLLWDDTFVRYHEPHIGIAAVKVLEAAGFEVTLATERRCCGRPAFSQGNLDEAIRLGTHNLTLLGRDTEETPVIFLEPSCYSMFKQDYRELNLPDAARLARRCFLFEEFMENLLDREPEALRFNPKSEKIVIHAHCHLKSMSDPGFLKRLAERLPERNATLLDTGCCGMAGAFGALESKYDLSVKVAEPLIRAVRDQPFGTVFVTSGTSCRHQVLHLAPIRSRHMAEVMAEALE